MQKIVLADDEQFIRIAYKDGLERAGFEVIVTADGEEAVRAVEENNPDILLLDLVMPKMNGFEALRKLKANPKFKALPIVVLSNLSQSTDEAEVRSLGATDFLVKSDLSLKELINIINDVLASSTKTTEPPTAK